jgi:GNAT superfamily N-acetyltransferase
MLDDQNLIPIDRNGTFVLPEYQRKGVGTMLSLVCNEIADRAGSKTFVTARPNSLHMLQKTGFEILAENVIDMTKFGGGEEDGKSWTMVREPQGKID